MSQTASLLCPLDLTDIAYSGVAAPPPPPISDDEDGLEGWAIALIVIFVVLFLAAISFAIMMYSAEKRGKPIFVAFDDVKVNHTNAPQQELVTSSH